MSENDIVAELEHRLRNQPYGCIIRRTEFPELIAVAPNVGDTVQVGQFKITRRKVDQLDQFTVSKPLPAKVPCPHCGKLIRARQSFCQWCDADLI